METNNITGLTDSIEVSRDFFKDKDVIKLAREIKLSEVRKCFDDEAFDTLIAEFSEHAPKNEKWVRIDNKPVYYYRPFNCVVADASRFECGKSSTHYSISNVVTDFCGFRGHVPSQGDNIVLFHQGDCPFRDSYTEEGLSSTTFFDGSYYYGQIGNTYYRFNNSYSYLSYHIPVYYFNEQSGWQERLNSFYGKERFKSYDDVVADFGGRTFFAVMLMNGLVPDFLSAAAKRFMEMLVEADGGIVMAADGSLTVTDEYVAAVFAGKVSSLMGVDLTEDECADFMLSFSRDHKLDLNEEQLAVVVRELTDCDKLRADIEPYDICMLTDINKGHWSLWSSAAPKSAEKKAIHEGDTADKVTIRLVKPLVGRNPLQDVCDDATVGIDFGTRSTVVSYIKGSADIRLKRIGAGKLSGEAKPSDYENPTIEEFIDLKSFLMRYHSADGRPETRWEDLKVSHTAKDDFANGGKDRTQQADFYSYLYDIKQWCGDSTGSRRLEIIDRRGEHRYLPAFIELEDNAEFDPVEIYAYYLGLFINNMNVTNGIYLDYLMSFPVNYTKEVREKIRVSFERGLRRSLPQQVLDSEECMSRFRVRYGASEPASYAVCALKSYNIKPEQGENMFYGVYDFGGGTTDFDFGIWRRKNKDSRREQRYNSVIEHFGADGDPRLGGETLLEMLAYEVFKANYKTLLPNEKNPKGITFSLPEDCRPFDGSEALIDDSQIAKRNIKILMEELRGFTENLKFKDGVSTAADAAPLDREFPVREIKSDYLDSKKDGRIMLNLFDRSGEMAVGVELYLVNKEKGINVDLLQLLTDRISLGVERFFDALSLARTSEHFKAKDYSFTGISIFLAGNSCRSPVVLNLFNEYIRSRFADTCEKLGIDPHTKLKVYPPLGTDEAKRICEQNGLPVADRITAPTGKTGVAYGLMYCRGTSGTLVINQIGNEEETPFKLHIGINDDDMFSVVLEKSAKYNKWVYFTDTYSDEFELYYTSTADAMNGNIPITQTSMKKCTISQVYEDDDTGVYIRAVEPNAIEYVCAREDGAVMLCEPVKIVLS